MSSVRIWIMTRDVVLFSGGLVGTAWQAYTDRIHPELLLLFAAMMGLPGVLSLRTASTSPRDGTAPTPGSSSPSPAPRPAPQSPPSSSA